MWVSPFRNPRIIMDMCSSPRLIAAYHVFLRLSVPRHPPCALLRLTCLSPVHSVARDRPGNYLLVIFIYNALSYILFEYILSLFFGYIPHTDGSSVSTPRMSSLNIDSSFFLYSVFKEQFLTADMQSSETPASSCRNLSHRTSAFSF